ncbi:MAG: permease [Eubacteriales bacterium]|nr:permease [Eubacteriales bacterium]
MQLFGSLISVGGVPFLLFSLLIISAAGYLLGSVHVKGISLGSAGVFIAALLYGALFYPQLDAALISGGSSFAANALKVVENIGLVFFVTAVGFIAGPKFFGNLKRNFKSYIVLGALIILSSGAACALCYFIGRGAESDSRTFVAILQGLLSGALTSTPGFSAAKATTATADLEAAVTVGYGIAYLFGVVGVVLFVQLIPKLTKADMAKERALISSANADETRRAYSGTLVQIDGFGFTPFALAAALGIVLGSVKIPLTGAGLSGPCFSLTTTGGTLVASLVFGHFAHVGPLSLTPQKKLLEVLRELGLILFLMGAGIAGGARFVEFFRPVYFLYGVVMTIVPMVAGYLFAKYVLKLNLLNNLGSITGGMTSTPALGTLIHVAGTEEVASAYAATYPTALLAVVLVEQFLPVLLG